ncbi:MAG: 2-dehydropantoate 2-reductase N-terminal domain-containing protein [Bacillota bacterium]|nr:2-dehydropantoate 2-reductase N-terminal domain-containing protein [Bacillota bacterium]
MRILIYGAGVIGSLYAVRFSLVGHEVSVYARGKRLQELSSRGLLYRSEDGNVLSASVSIVSVLDDDDLYDFVFLTVRGDQVISALTSLNANKSPVIVTMANTAGAYSVWEAVCGPRILPAFPGAGGSIDDGVLDAALTPPLIQPTTYGALRSEMKPAERRLGDLFRSAGIPSSRCRNMQNWQISHLGLVVPLAEAYYLTSDPKEVHRDRERMYETAKTLRSNFNILARRGVLVPKRFHFIRFLPLRLLRFLLTKLYASAFAETFMYRHSINAPDEMRRLREQWNHYIES